MPVVEQWVIQLVSGLLTFFFVIGLVAHIKTPMPPVLKWIGVAMLLAAIFIVIRVAVTPMSEQDIMLWYLMAAVLWSMAYMQRARWRYGAPTG